MLFQFKCVEVLSSNRITAHARNSNRFKGRDIMMCDACSQPTFGLKMMQHTLNNDKAHFELIFYFKILTLIEKAYRFELNKTVDGKSRGNILVKAGIQHYEYVTKFSMHYSVCEQKLVCCIFDIYRYKICTAGLFSWLAQHC